MIKAVIFDCFGVLTSDGWIPFKNKHFGDQPDKLKRAIELNRQLDAGRMNYENGVREIAEMAGVTPHAMDRVLRDVIPNQALLAYICKNLQPNYRLGILSNVAGNWLESFFRTEDLKLFDVVTLSYEEGILKPDPRSYASIAARLGVKAEEAIFIDDGYRNVMGAQKTGMRAILYKDFEQMKAELENLLAADAES